MSGGTEENTGLEGEESAEKKMAQSCLKFLKYALITFNFIFWWKVQVVCCTLPSDLLVPSLVQLHLSQTCWSLSLVQLHSTIRPAGPVTSPRSSCTAFFIVLLILMMVEIAMSIILLIYEEKIDGFLLKEFEASLQKYTHSNATQGTEDWDIIQHKFMCCGVKGVGDWNGTVPFACCKESNCANGIYWQEGCYEKLKQWFEYNYLNVGIGIIVISIIQVLGMSFAMTLYCHISKSGIFFQ
ncbi:leukocyte surface antigen CD53-like [Huso huso]|uniref:Tetraspanin n=1 Tax=Huso huso TaxID=61971 RepID=A0ABR0YDH9_HUSHU